MILKDFIKRLRDNNPDLIAADLTKETILDQGKMLEILQAIKANTTLKTLKLDLGLQNTKEIFTLLTELISSNKILQNLHLKKQFTDEELALIIKALAQNNKLKELKIQGVHNDELTIGDQTLKAISDTFTKSKNSLKTLGLNRVKFNAEKGREALELIGKAQLNSLNLDQNKFDDVAIENLLNGLRNNANDSLELLSLANSNLTLKGLSLIVDFLAYNGNIKTLNLSKNDFSNNDEIDALIKLIRNNTTIEELLLDNTRISPQNALNIISALEQNPDSAITSLSFNSTFNKSSINTDNDKEIVGQVITKLIQDKRIKKINVLNNEITAKASVAIGNALKTNSSLTMLAIGNYVNTNTLKPILKALKNNTTLEEFTLESSYMDSIEMSIFSDTLKKNNTLTTLNLSYINNLGDYAYDDAYPVDVDVDEQGNTINEINLDYSPYIKRDQRSGINSSKLEDLRKGLIENKSIVMLDLSCNVINDHCAAIIGLLLKDNRTLETLILNDNLIFEKGFKAIAEGLKNNYILTELIYDRDFDQRSSYQAVQDILSRNKSHYSTILKDRINEIKMLNDKINKINSKKEFSDRIYGLTLLYKEIPPEIEHDSTHRLELIEKMYAIIISGLQERVLSPAFDYDNIVTLNSYLETFNLVKRNNDACKELFKTLSSQIELKSSDSESESESENDGNNSKKRGFNFNDNLTKKLMKMG